MKTKSLAIVAIILAFAMALTACGGGAAPSAAPGDASAQPSASADPNAPAEPVNPLAKTELVLAIGGEPDEGFDPCTGWGRYGHPLFQSTLLEYGENMAIENDLAESYTVSDDGLTWTFKIRPDVKFTDGEPLKASDVAFTYNTAKASSSDIDLTSMDAASAPDSTTVVFKLNKPMSAFVNIAATLGIVPEHAYSKTYSQNPIGSGPYKFVQWDKGQQLIVTLNHDYYADKPKFEKLTFLYIGEDAAFAAVQAGTVDIAMTVPTLAQGMPNYDMLRCKSVDNRGVSMPVTKAGGKSADGLPVGNDVTADPVVRKAICYAVDRQKLVDDVLRSAGSPAYSVCDGLPWWNEQTAIKDGDVEGQKAALEAAGWIDTDGDGIREKDGLKASLNLVYPASDSVRQALAMAFAQQMKEIGIEFVVKGASWDDIGQVMYSDCVMFGWGSQSPMEMYNLYYGKGVTTGYNNPTNCVNPTVDKYIDAALAATDNDVAMENWKKAQWDGTTGFSMLGDASWCWLVNIEHLYYVRDGLKTGLQPIHPHGHGYPVIANIKDWYYLP